MVRSIADIMTTRVTIARALADITTTRVATGARAHVCASDFVIVTDLIFSSLGTTIMVTIGPRITAADTMATVMVTAMRTTTGRGSRSSTKEATGTDAVGPGMALIQMCLVEKATRGDRVFQGTL